MPEIVVLSRVDAEEFEPDRPWAAISITSEDGDWPDLAEEGRVGLLQLAFADVAAVDLRDAGDVFCLTDADEILDFLELADEIDLLLVHCEMGLSRSPAVAAAIARVLRGPGAEAPYFDVYSPNALVYRTLIDVAGRRGLLDEPDAD